MKFRSCLCLGCLLLGLASCGADPVTEPPSNLVASLDLAREGERAAPTLTRALTPEDVTLWCEVEIAARAARGGRNPLAASADAQAARRRVLEKHDVSFLEHQVIHARLSVALMHLEQKIPAPPEKRADVDLVRQELSRIRAARGR